MVRPREEICGTAFHRFVSELAQHRTVPRGCRGIAGYHHYLNGRHLRHILERVTRAALPRRVGYDDVGTLAALENQPRRFARVAADELRVRYAVRTGVRPCVIYRLRDDLHADQFLHAVSHRKPYRPRAAVEVEQRLASRQPGKSRRLRVDPLRLNRVYLVE